MTINRENIPSCGTLPLAISDLYLVYRLIITERIKISEKNMDPTRNFCIPDVGGAELATFIAADAPRAAVPIRRHEYPIIAGIYIWFGSKKGRITSGTNPQKNSALLTVPSVLTIFCIFALALALELALEAPAPAPVPVPLPVPVEAIQSKKLIILYYYITILLRRRHNRFLARSIF